MSGYYNHEKEHLLKNSHLSLVQGECALYCCLVNVLTLSTRVWTHDFPSHLQREESSSAVSTDQLQL